LRQADATGDIWKWRQFPRDVISFWQGAERDGFFERRQLRKASALAMLKKQNLMASDRHTACSSAVSSLEGCCAAVSPAQDRINENDSMLIARGRMGVLIFTRIRRF
jgi:hypothetical protein